MASKSNYSCNRRSRRSRIDGSHAVLPLKNTGYKVVILDNLVYGHRDLVEKVLQVELVVGGTNDCALLDHLFKTYRQVTGRSIKTLESDRRSGDPPVLIGSSEKAKKILGWNPQYPNLEDILFHAWQWHQKRHGAN